MTGISLSPLEALADELGAVAARIERELRQRFDIMLAELRAEVSGLQTKAVEMELRAIKAERAHDELIAARLAELQDGAPGRDADMAQVEAIIATLVRDAVVALPPPAAGRDADPAEIERLIAAEIAKLPPSVDGKDADIEVIKEIIAEEVAKLPPAQPGRDADPATIRHMVQEAVAELPAPKDGRDGASVDLDDLVPIVADEIAKAVAALPPPKDGEPGRDADPSCVAEMVAAAVAAIPPSQPGKDVDIEVVREMIADEVAKLPTAAPGKDADPAVIREIVAEAIAALPPAAPGEPGKEGPPGKLDLVNDWSDRVHYQGVVVAHNGSSYQALCDTGREPPHEDWRCIAAAGRGGADGRSFNIRSTWSADDPYSAMDVVALNGASFVARYDDPGTCPGEGWQMIAAQGKRGQAGEGVKGDPGKRGDPGPPVAAIDVDDQAVLTVTNGDGSTVACDLYPLLAKLQ